ncbi:hypothetical protein ENUP19_0305G0104 [Entamoeba nuttalli]|uniref:DOCKER domain-containing protein n=1 Tax=Entamoeba nuttalli TaxID=412467 RepID=A0ABQ0DVH5_9EUKA
MVGLSKADVRRTFKTYAMGKNVITVDDAYEMFRDMDDGFKKTIDEFKVDFEQFDENKDEVLDVEEKYDLERRGFLDTIEIKKFIKNEFGVDVTDMTIKELVHERTMGEESCHISLKNFCGFKKLVETNKEEIIKNQLEPFSIEQHVNASLFLYKLTIVQNSPIEIKGFTGFQKRFIQSLERNKCYLLKPRKSFKKNIPQEYFSSPQFDEICSDFQLRKQRLTTYSQPIPFEFKTIHLFECFNPTLQINDSMNTYIAQQPHVLKQMISINIESITFNVGLFEPLIISLSIYNYKTREKQTENVYTFITNGELRKDLFLFELEKIEKNEYYLVIQVFRKDDGNSLIGVLYSEGIDENDSKKSKRQLEAIEKIKKKEDESINMMSLQQIAIGSVRIVSITQKTHLTDLKFFSVKLQEETDIFKLIKTTPNNEVPGKWSVCWDLINKPDTNNPLSEFRIIEATQIKELYNETQECVTPRSGKHQRMRSTRSRLFNNNDSPSTVTCQIKTSEKQSLFRVQNMSPSHVFRSETTISSSLYLTLIDLVLSRERKITGTIEISLQQTIGGEPLNALLIPNYSIVPEKKIVFSFKGNDKIIPIMKEIRIELPKPPQTNLFIFIRMSDNTDSVAFIPLFSKNGGIMDSGIEQRIAIYKGSGDKFLNDAFNGKGASKRTLVIKLNSVATFYPRLHIIHSFINSDNKETIIEAIKTVKNMDAKVIAPYLNTILDRMFEMIEFVELYNFNPILQQFFTEDEIRPLILVDYVNDHFSPKELNSNFRLLPKLILVDVINSFNNFEESEYNKFKLTFFFFQCFIKSCVVADKEIKEIENIEKLLQRLLGLIVFRIDIHISKRDIRGVFELNLNVAELFRDLFSVMNKDFVCQAISYYYNLLCERNAIKLDKQMDLSFSTVYEIMRLDFLCVIRDYPLMIEINCPSIHNNDITTLNDTFCQSKFLATFFVYSITHLIFYHKNDIRIMASLCLLELIQKFDIGVAYQEYRSVAAEEFSSLISLMIDEFDVIKEWSYEVFFNTNGTSNPNQLFALRALFLCFFYIINEVSDEFRQTYIRTITPFTVNRLLQLFYIGQNLFKPMDHHMQGTQGLYDFLRNKLVIQLMKFFERELLTIRSLYTFNTSCAIFIQKSRGMTVTSKDESLESDKKRKKRHNTTKETSTPVLPSGSLPVISPFQKRLSSQSPTQPQLQTKEISSVTQEKHDEVPKKKRRRKFSLFALSDKKSQEEEIEEKQQNTTDNLNEQEKKGLKKVLLKAEPNQPSHEMSPTTIKEEEKESHIKEVSSDKHHPEYFYGSRINRKSTSLPRLNIRSSTVVDKPKNIGFEAAKEIYGPTDDVCPQPVNRNVQIKQETTIQESVSSTKKRTLPNNGNKPLLQRFESAPKLQLDESASPPKTNTKRLSSQKNNVLFKSADLDIADILIESSQENTIPCYKQSSSESQHRSPCLVLNENNDSLGKTLSSRNSNNEIMLECSEDTPTSELAKTARALSSNQNPELTYKSKVIRRRKGSFSRPHEDGTTKIKTGLMKPQCVSDSSSPLITNNCITESQPYESPIYSDELKITITPGNGSNTNRDVGENKSHNNTKLKQLKVPKLEMKKIQKEESRLKISQLEHPDFVINEAQSSARLRTSTAIQISQPLNRMIKQNSLIQSLEEGDKKNGRLPAIEFMFGLPLETPRNKQRRQTEGGTIKTPRGMEESFITEKTGINNEKVLNVYLYGMINTIVSKASTLCFLYHDQNEDIRKMSGKIFGELSLALNNNALVSDLSFLGLEKFIRVCGDEVVPLISPIIQALMRIVLGVHECVAPRAAEIIWLLCFMNYVSKQSVSTTRDAMITYLFHGKSDFQRLPNLVYFLQSVPFVRLQSMFDMLVQQRNSSALEMVKSNQLCLEVQTIDTAIFEGHAEDCVVFFNEILEKRIELLNEIKHMEGSVIGRETEIQLSIVLLLFKTMKLKEEQINTIEAITIKFYSEQEEIMKQLKRMKSLFECYMDLHNSIKRNCKNSTERVGALREQCSKCKEIVTSFFKHLVNSINDVTPENIRKGASYLNQYQQSFDELVSFGVDCNPLFPVTPDELSDIFQMYKTLNIQKFHSKKRSLPEMTNESKTVRIKSLREMSIQISNLYSFLRNEPKTPRLTPRKAGDTRSVSTITPKKKRMSGDNTRILKRTSTIVTPVSVKFSGSYVLPDSQFSFEHNQLIYKMMPELSSCIESNNESLKLMKNNEKAQDLLTKIVELLYISEKASSKINESDKNHEENKMLMEKLYGVFEWAYSAQILLSFEPPEPNDYLSIFVGMLNIIEQNKEKQIKAYHELQKTVFKTPQQIELMEKINKIIVAIPHQKIIKTVRDVRKRCSLEEQREIQRKEYAKYYDEFISLSRQCLLTTQRSEFKAFNKAKEAYHFLSKMSCGSIIGINRYVHYVGMEESLETLYQKLIKKGLSKCDSKTELSDLTSISFRLTDISAMLRSPIYITSCNSSSNLIESIHSVGNEIFSVSLELQGLLSLKGKYQIDELTERYYALCVKYRSSPLLHLSWLNNIIEKEIEFGYYLEAGICEIQAVYYIYRVTKGNDIGILNVNHLASICSDFLIDRTDINEVPLEFTKELLLAHAYHAIELFRKAKMTWFGVEVCLMLKEFFENNNMLDELATIHQQMAEFFLGYANGSSIDYKFYLVQIGESQFVYASPCDKQEFKEMYLKMCETIGYDIVEPQQVYPIINEEVQTVPVPQITTANKFTYEIFEGDSDKMMDIIAVKGIYKTQSSLPSGLRRSIVVEQYDEVLTPVRYSIEVVERMIESLSFYVCECEKNGTSSLKAIKEMREYMTQNIINEESFSVLSIIKNFFPGGEDDDTEGIQLLQRNLQRLRSCCDKAYSTYQLLSQEMDKIQTSFRKKYMIFSYQFADFITNFEDMDLY